MPAELQRHDAGLFFLTEGLSEHGCSPTKIGEYWACGLPVVTTPNVSDTDAIVQSRRVGVVVRSRRQTGFDDAAWEWILSHSWPGNVRELKNAVERAVIMTRGDKIKAADIMPRHLRRQDPNTTLTVPPGATLADTRRQLVLRAFASTNGDYARTATIVGMTPGDVRAEIASLLNGNAGDGAVSTGAVNGAQRSAKPGEPAPTGKAAKAPAKAAAGAAAKSKAKKR